MTATIAHLRRAWVPALNMLLALTAVVIAVIALAIAPSEVTEVVPQPPSADAPQDPTANPPAQPDSRSDRLINQCDRLRGTHPC